MKLVSIRHDPGQSSRYYFIVPEHLKNKVCVGAEVVCDTRRGYTSGEVMEIFDEPQQIEDVLRREYLEPYQLKCIVEVTKVPAKKKKISIVDNESVNTLLFGEAQ